MHLKAICNSVYQSVCNMFSTHTCMSNIRTKHMSKLMCIPMQLQQWVLFHNKNFPLVYIKQVRQVYLKKSGFPLASTIVLASCKLLSGDCSLRSSGRKVTTSVIC